MTGGIEGLRDAWGTSFDYIGDIKSGQPNGLGIAIYTNNNALRYSGYFVNGQYSGKGVLLFKDSTFLSGEWKNGKLNGKGASLNSGGDFYVGYFANGIKEGSGAFVFNELYVGSFEDGSFTGTGYIVFKNGKTLKGTFNNGLVKSLTSLTDENGAGLAETGLFRGFKHCCQ